MGMLRDREKAAPTVKSEYIPIHLFYIWRVEVLAGKGSGKGRLVKIRRSSDAAMKTPKRGSGKRGLERKA
ncbi:MAG TPA: hypothetical protein VFV38_35140 [Ktedonobacteraceae bacterium]|nr:hypothetical protein [Ktedonobacteraceae bacterium]